MDLQKNPCRYFLEGKVKASTLSLSVLVTIEMLNAFNAISEDHSLLTVTPLVNPYLFVACAVALGLHFVILYVPFLAAIFSIAPLNVKEWTLVFAFSFPVIVIDEILKVFGRMKNAAALKQRLLNKTHQKE
jgi:Ca2+-transporting ATPase